VDLLDLHLAIVRLTFCISAQVVVVVAALAAQILLLFLHSEIEAEIVLLALMLLAEEAVRFKLVETRQRTLPEKVLME
jgi:hypothetical protein